MEAARAVADVLRRAWLAAALTGVACSEPQETFGCAGQEYTRDVRPWGLANLPNLDLEVAYVEVFGSSDHDLRLTVYYGERLTLNRGQYVAPLWPRDHGYCAEVDSSFTATLDGVALSAEVLGDEVCYLASGAVCEAPRFSIRNPVIRPDSTLVVEDRTMSTTIAVGAVPGVPGAARAP
jgi:hypothetical protein